MTFEVTATSPVKLNQSSQLNLVDILRIPGGPRNSNPKPSSGRQMVNSLTKGKGINEEVLKEYINRLRGVKIFIIERRRGPIGSKTHR